MKVLKNKQKVNKALLVALEELKSHSDRIQEKYGISNQHFPLY